MSKTIIYGDTETTGVYPKSGDRIVEVGLLAIHPDGSREVWHRYVNPERSVPAAAREIHGLDDAFLADKPVFSDIADELADFLDGQTVVIHNAGFDVAFLKAEFERAGRKLPKFEVVDTLAKARRALPGAKHSLDALCDRFEVDRSERTTHGTLIDVELLSQVHAPLEALAAEIDAKFNGLFDEFQLDQAGSSDSLDELLDRHAAVKGAKNRLEAAEEAIRGRLLALTDGKPYADDKGRSIEFTTGTRTDWKKVVEEHLQGVDLSPYQKSTSSMVVKN